jgi:hypothetical protein
MFFLCKLCGFKIDFFAQYQVCKQNNLDLHPLGNCNIVFFIFRIMLLYYESKISEI